MMNKEEYTICFEDQTGFRISECDIATGKVVVNGIEITSVEDWKKVTKSLIDLQQRIDKIMEIIELNQYSYGYQIKDEILGGKDGN